jgi:hypothetical protein
LAERTGLGGSVLGAALVILLLGLTSVRCSLVLFNLVRERLPAGAQPVQLEAGDLSGVRLADLVALPEVPRQLALRLLRQGEARFASTRPSRLPQHVWDALGAGSTTAPAAAPTPSRLSAIDRRLRAALLSRQGRFLLSVSPVGLAFVLAVWLMAAGVASFATLLSFTGIITVSVFGGIFPALLLIASRRKGERAPAATVGAVGHAAVATGVYLLFLAILVVHGLVIWEGAPERAGALLAAFVVLWATALMVRGGAFAPRLVVELCADARGGTEGPVALTTTLGGRPVPATIQWGAAGDALAAGTVPGQAPTLAALRAVRIELPATEAREVKIWVHRLTPEGESEGLPAAVELHSGDTTRRAALDPWGGQVLLPFGGTVCALMITVAESSAV